MLQKSVGFEQKSVNRAYENP